MAARQRNPHRRRLIVWIFIHAIVIAMLFPYAAPARHPDARLVSITLVAIMALFGGGYELVKFWQWERDHL